MNTLKKLTLALSMTAALAGCKTGDPMKEFVAEEVSLSERSGELVGTIPFAKTQYFTDTRYTCDRVQCGTDYRRQCDYDTVCRPGPQVCSPGHNVCVPTGTPVCYTDPRTGRRVCNGGGGGAPSCHWEPGYCHSGPSICERIVRACWDVPVPRYCDVNCRNEPFRNSRNVATPSLVTVRIVGGSIDDVKGMRLGIETNGRFAAAVVNPNLRPKGFDALFASLKPTDKTVFVLKAKGLELVPGQEFLRLPADFKAGQPVTVELQVRRAASNKTVFSAVGTASQLPELHQVEQLP